MIRVLRTSGYGRETVENFRQFSKHSILHTRRLISNPKILIRWGSQAPVNFRVGHEINTASSIYRASNKALFRKICRLNGVKIPDTYFPGEEIPVESYPLILRPRTHFGANNLWVANSPEELETVPWDYASTYIPKDREHRFFCVSGKIVCASEKIPEDKEQIAWNHSEGSSFQNLRWGNWPLKAAKESLKAIKITGLDFGAVDLIMKGEEYYVLEVNTAFSLTGEYQPECLAKGLDYLIDYILENGEKVYFPIPEEVNNWRDLIHPAIYERN